MPWIRRRELEALTAEARAAALVRLRAQIDDRLDGRSDSFDFWRETEVIVAELRRPTTIFGATTTMATRAICGVGTIMHAQQAGWLQIQFNFGAPCQTFWRGEDERLSTACIPS